MTEEQRNDELDEIFGADTNPANQGLPAQGAVGQEGAAKISPFEPALKMQISDRMKRLIAAGKKLAAKRRAHEQNPKLKSPPKPPQKPDTSSVSEMLTPSEIEQLKQKQKEVVAYAQKVYPGLKIAT